MRWNGAVNAISGRLTETGKVKNGKDYSNR